MKYTYLIGILLFPILLYSQTLYTVQPNTADPSSGTPNNRHFIYINKTVPAKNKLFLFFPGTFALPYNYREILKHASNLGYHSIGLSYPNTLMINSTCATSTDTSCHSRARLEVFDGVDRHIDITVDSNNCIKRRTLKLLQYLHSRYPLENWDLYYTGTQINWNKIIVSGHSQGGGHAGIISKIKEVDRVAMFAAMDWMPTLNRNADWITWNSLTPKDRYYGFVHEHDELADFSKIQTTWNNYKMNSLGKLIKVDTSSLPFDNSRMLYTSEKPANDSTKFHGSIVADAYTPFVLGNPLFLAVWTYMIEGNNPVLSIASNSKFKAIKAYPNPVNSTLNITGWDCTNYNYSIYNVQGQIVASEQSTIGCNIDCSNLNKGIFFIKIRNESRYETIKFIKQ
jgi:hypothetical protein